MILKIYYYYSKMKKDILFEYLKSRILLFQKYFDKFIYDYSDIKTSELFQKVLLNNLIYMTEDKRISYFNELLLDMIYNRQMYHSQKTINIDRFK